MPGVRLVHESIRGRSLAVEHPARRYTRPYLCPRCNTTHLKKTVHLDFDGEGATIVSVETFKLLRESGMPGLTMTNAVANPPAQHIGLSADEALKGLFAGEEKKYQGKMPGRLFVLKNRLLGPKQGASPG